MNALIRGLCGEHTYRKELHRLLVRAFLKGDNMKYIRTKTKIEEIESALNNKELFDYLKQFDNYKDDLIKVADTIEELCDEFVCFGNLDKKQFSIADTFEEAKDFVKFSYYDNIYGAIWTDKGLIYVAKMNDKGELELL